MPDNMPIEGRGTSFEKRVKRRVTGRVHSFFAATAPGLEKLCLSELLSLPLSEKQASVVTGGVAFTGRLHDCYLANLHLRCANRVLMRIADFRASGFSVLEKKLADVDWELFLPPKGPFRISVASSKSRLYHRGAVAQRVLGSIFASMGQGNETASGPDTRIFVRAESDRFTVSLDSSGELLHKRGIKSRGGKAPIRETLASAVLAMAGYRPGRLLVDPMCGSGSFSLEAAMISRNMPAGWFRGFAFERWPAFSPGRWRHLRREAEAELADSPPCVFASDLQEKPVQLLETQVSDHGLSNTVVHCLDFFDLTPEVIFERLQGGSESFSEPGLIVLNPPYGRRLGSLSESRSLLESIYQKLRKDFSGWDLALIAPRRMAGKRMTSAFNTTPLFHGGLDLVLLTGKIAMKR